MKRLLRWFGVQFADDNEEMPQEAAPLEGEAPVTPAEDEDEIA